MVDRFLLIRDARAVQDRPHILILALGVLWVLGSAAMQKLTKTSTKVGCAFFGAVLSADEASSDSMYDGFRGHAVRVLTSVI